MHTIINYSLLSSTISVYTAAAVIRRVGETRSRRLVNGSCNRLLIIKAAYKCYATVPPTIITSTRRIATDLIYSLIFVIQGAPHTFNHLPLLCNMLQYQPRLPSHLPPPPLAIATRNFTIRRCSRSLYSSAKRRLPVWC